MSLSMELNVNAILDTEEIPMEIVFSPTSDPIATKINNIIQLLEPVSVSKEHNLSEENVFKSLPALIKLPLTASGVSVTQDIHFKTIYVSKFKLLCQYAHLIPSSMVFHAPATRDSSSKLSMLVLPAQLELFGMDRDVEINLMKPALLDIFTTETSDSVNLKPHLVEITHSSMELPAFA